MTLYTTDYLEYYLTPGGLGGQQRHLEHPRGQRRVALLFVAIVIQEWLRRPQRRCGRGQQGRCRRCASRTGWVAIVVIMFAGIPFIPVDLATIRFDTTRPRNARSTSHCPTTRAGPTFHGGAQRPERAGAGVVVLHARAVESRDGLRGGGDSRGTDLRQIRMDVDATRIDDPVLAQEVADFTHDCYGPSRAKLFMNRPTLSDEQMNDVTWIGSSYFLDTPGFYDTYRAKTTHGLALRRDPRCRVGTGGQRRRLSVLPAVVGRWRPGDCAAGCWHRSTDLLTRIGRWVGFLSQSEVNDSVIRAVRLTAAAEDEPGRRLAPTTAARSTRRCRTSSRAARATWG